MTRSEHLRARLERLQARVAALDARSEEILRRARPLRQRVKDLKVAAARADREEELRQKLATLPRPEGPKITHSDHAGLAISGALRRAGVTHQNQWHAMAKWPRRDVLLIPGLNRKTCKALNEIELELELIGGLL